MWRSYQQINRRNSKSINVGNVKVGGDSPYYSKILIWSKSFAV